MSVVFCMAVLDKVECWINEGWIIGTVLCDSKVANKSPEVWHI